MDGLEPINVFLDTSVFVSLNYNYTNHLFVALRERVVQGRARLVMPTSTVDEVKVHIKKDVGTAAQAIRKARTDTRVLRNIRSVDFAALFDDIKIDALANELTEAFDAFLIDMKAEIVDVEDADTKHVFKLYFSNNATFRLRQEKV